LIHVDFKKRKRFLIVSVIILIILGAVVYTHLSFYGLPKGRLGLNKTYSKMKEDDFHHYVDFQLDYTNPSLGKFRGFYLLSPNFYKSENITFLLTDGQMELVSLQTDFNFFEGILGNSAYVLIGVRGHSPTFIPEVYNDGKIDYKKALKFYNSDQQVEDIEQVRLNLIKKGLLSSTSKINVFGASGAGILAQQYISKYGQYVNRVILESTGAPDLAIKNNLKYSPDYKLYNPAAYAVLAPYLEENPAEKASVCNILYQQGRTERSPREVQLQTVNDLINGGSLLKYTLKPITNLTVLNYMIKSPKSLAVRIRWFELVGHDLLKYDSSKRTNLLYELSLVAVSDVLEYHKVHNIPPKEFKIERDFNGEVLLIKGTEDVVFGDDINIILQKAYPNAKIVFFEDGHRMQKDQIKYRAIRSQFLTNGFKGLQLMK